MSLASAVRSGAIAGPAALCAIALSAAVSVHGQQAPPPTRAAPGQSTLSGGKPTAPTSPWQPKRRKDGQPEIEGYYIGVGPEGSAGLTIEELAHPNGGPGVSKTVVVDPPDGRIPYLPWARTRRDEVKDSHLTPSPAQLDTRNRGWPDGVPRITYYTVNPFQILQPEGAVLILYEAQHEFRFIPLDGRPQIDPNVKLWMGSSRGHWEGTTLVVDVANVTDRVRFSVVGDFASPDVKITERWQWISRGKIKHSATFEDPNVYSRPWTVSKQLWQITEPHFEIMEYSGVEGDKDAHLMVDIPASNNQRR
jgi:hypothetical protein